MDQVIGLQNGADRASHHGEFPQDVHHQGRILAGRYLFNSKRRQSVQYGQTGMENNKCSMCTIPSWLTTITVGWSVPGTRSTPDAISG